MSQENAFKVNKNREFLNFNTNDIQIGYGNLSQFKELKRQRVTSPSFSFPMKEANLSFTLSNLVSETQTDQTNNLALGQRTQNNTEELLNKDGKSIYSSLGIPPATVEKLPQVNSPKSKIDTTSILIPSIAILATLLCTFFTIWRDNQKSIDERFLKTVELIGHDKPAVRSGAIISLKQVFKDSPSKQKESIELLANLVRINSPAPKSININRTVPSDVAMALKVIKQTDRKVKDETDRIIKDEEPINLSYVNLFDVDLSKGELENISFNHSHLRDADLTGARLEGAYFKFAYLKLANMKGAHLEKAHLEDADLENANLDGTHLEFANFSKERSKQIKRACNWYLAFYQPSVEEELGVKEMKKMKGNKPNKSRRCKHFSP